MNHLGGPLGIGPYRGDRSRVRADWRASVERLAARPNVFLKLGGIGMDDYFATGWAARAVPPGSEEVAEHWGDDVRLCIDCFGPGRCMFESNFPVDRQTLTYPGGVERLPDHGLRLHRRRAGRPVLRHRRPGLPAVRHAVVTRSAAAGCRLS